MTDMIEFMVLLAVLTFWIVIFGFMTWILLKIPFINRIMERLFEAKQADLTNTIILMKSDEKTHRPTSKSRL